MRFIELLLQPAARQPHLPVPEQPKRRSSFCEGLIPCFPHAQKRRSAEQSSGGLKRLAPCRVAMVVHLQNPGVSGLQLFDYVSTVSPGFLGRAKPALNWPPPPHKVQNQEYHCNYNK